jgi:opacity protein-like surface antigen
MSRKSLFLVLLLLVMGTGVSAFAQEVPPWEISARAATDRSNLVASGGCCFWMNGGTGSMAWNGTGWLAFAAEGTAYGAGQVERTGKSLMVLTCLAGPRISYRRRSSFTAFGQLLLGAARVRGTLYNPTDGIGRVGTGPEFAFGAGGGVDFDLKPKLSVRLIQMDYLHTQFSNGVNGRQSSLSLSAGIVYRFGTPSF